MTSDAGDRDVFSWESPEGRAARLVGAQRPAGAVLHIGGDGSALGVALDRLGAAWTVVDVANGQDLDAVRETVEALPSPVVAIVVLDVASLSAVSTGPAGLLADLVRLTARRQDGEAPLAVVAFDNQTPEELALGGADAGRNLGGEQDLVGRMTAGGFTEVVRSDIMRVGEPADGHDGRRASADTSETMLSSYLRQLLDRSGTDGSVATFLRGYEWSERAAPPAMTDGEAGPFLTVIMRTRGDRWMVEDALTCVAAQSDRDVEVLLMVHHDDPTVVEHVGELVGRFERPFRLRVRLHQVVGGGRSRPLNDALSVARGTYVTVLDDDDIVTPDWVATFRRLAASAPGHVLRAVSVVQQIEQRHDSPTGFETVSGFDAAYPETFVLVDAIRSNRSPTCSYAIPREAIDRLGLRYDESLRVCEDWKFEVEAARVVGTVDEPVVTSVYRSWRTAGGSSAEESRDVWNVDHERVIDALDETPTLFPPGTLRRIYHLYKHVEALEAELGRRRPDDPPYLSRP